MYFLHDRLEICSLLVKEKIEFINETEIAVLEEFALLLGVINYVPSDLLNVDFILIAFYIPTFKLIKSNIVWIV